MKQVVEAMQESKRRHGSDHRAHLIEMLARDDIPNHIRSNMRTALSRTALGSKLTL